MQLQQIKRARCSKCQALGVDQHRIHTNNNAAKQNSSAMQSHHKERDQTDTNSIIVEEAIESSISNIEMSKSEKSLQKPLKLAVSTLPSAQEKNPSMKQLTSANLSQAALPPAHTGKQDSQKSKTDASLRDQSTVSNIQSQDPIVGLANNANGSTSSMPRLIMGRESSSDALDEAGAGSANAVMQDSSTANLEVDSQTDLPQEYFQFIAQENQSMKEEIDQITDQFQMDALEHKRQKEDWLRQIEELQNELESLHSSD